MAREWSATRSRRHSSDRYAARGVTLVVVHRMAVLARGARRGEEPGTAGRRGTVPPPAAPGGAMAYTYDDLKAMTIADLREIARGLQPALQGYTQMNKEHLLPALCAALGVDTHHHHRHAHRPHQGAHQVFDRPTMKATLRTLKTERARALDAHDGHALHEIRRRMHALKHRLRMMAE